MTRFNLFDKADKVLQTCKDWAAGSATRTMVLEAATVLLIVLGVIACIALGCAVAYYGLVWVPQVRGENQC